MKVMFFLLVIVWLLSGLAMVHFGGYYIFGVFFLAILFIPLLTWARDRGDPRDRDDRPYLPAGYTSILAVDGPSAPEPPLQTIPEPIEVDAKEETAEELRMKALIEGWKTK